MLLDGRTIPDHEIGDVWQLSGCIISNATEALGMVLPFIEPLGGIDSSDMLQPTDEEWQAWLKRSDDPLMPIGSRQPNGTLLKALVRKSSRQIDESIKWRVYDRDNYTCRYCGARGVPMTVDHYLAQTFGGETSYDNLLTSCRPCNKKKGHKTIEEWKTFCRSHGLKHY
jgi:hypothetical protein